MKVVFIENTPMKILLEPYYFSINGKSYKIPQWYAFDGLSIPRPCQWLVDMNDTENIEAGLEHDFWYSKISGIQKEIIDKHLLQRTRRNNGKRAVLVYLWVYFFGFLSYQKDSNYKKYEKEIKQKREELWFTISIS